LYNSGSLNDKNEVKACIESLSELKLRRFLFWKLNENLEDSIDLKSDTNLLIRNIVDNFAKIDLEDESVSNPLAVLEQLEKEMNLIQEGKRLKPGFEMLDRLLPYFIPGHLWIVGGYTGVGKSWFALQLIKNVVDQGGDLAFFSLEMQNFENLGRLIGSHTGDGYQALWSSNIGKKYLQSPKIKDYIGKIDERLNIYDNLRSVRDISVQIRSLLLKQKVDIVVIDFIQNIDIGNSNVYEGFRKIAQEIQAITKKLHITTILVSQLSNSYAKTGGKSGVVEYKNAGELAAAADVGIVLFDHTNKYKETMMRQEHKLDFSDKPILCDVGKSRHTSGGKIPFILEFPSGRVVEAPAKFDWINTSRRDDYYKSKDDLVSRRSSEDEAEADEFGDDLFVNDEKNGYA